MARPLMDYPPEDLIYCATVTTKMTERVQRLLIAIAVKEEEAFGFAVEVGAQLHWAKSQLVDPHEWGAWREENFPGTEEEAITYLAIARAYSVHPEAFAGCERIEDAITITIALPPDQDDLPPLLPGLLVP